MYGLPLPLNSLKGKVPRDIHKTAVVRLVSSQGSHSVPWVLLPCGALEGLSVTVTPSVAVTSPLLKCVWLGSPMGDGVARGVTFSPCLARGSTRRHCKSTGVTQRGASPLHFLVSDKRAIGFGCHLLRGAMVDHPLVCGGARGNVDGVSAFQETGGVGAAPHDHVVRRLNSRLSGHPDGRPPLPLSALMPDSDRRSQREEKQLLFRTQISAVTTGNAFCRL